MNDRERIQRETDEITVLLKELVDDTIIPIWLQKPNNAFGGKTPVQMIQEGRTNELRAAIEAMASDQPF